MKYQAIWRNPAVQTNGFPKLMVSDDTVTGSINIRNSRLPLWAIIDTAINEGWESVEEGWEISRYNYKSEDLSHFLYCLLEHRGEFGRLLLLLANAEDKSECWWETKTHRQRVIRQLQRCLDVLKKLSTHE